MKVQGHIYFQDNPLFVFIYFYHLIQIFAYSPKRTCKIAKCNDTLKSDGHAKVSAS